ncbi:xylose isomerase [Mucilaginibacter hurinus]|uniref:Xylose isomerase n=2 Tax=Mucilaginibacter hurinus TaxID=2201324 RepID=A0A367GLH2_9SPHI|nr:xylose isomerase [Mucilaginibacter hurinus]
MELYAGHLTYCTNIHAGESWAAHFDALQQNFPLVKSQLSPDKPMGIGLRLSNQASIEILLGDNMFQFKQWLQQTDAYVFTMNGFPYGGFHHIQVKDQVHAPDWTTTDRLAYTLRLFRILSALLPPGMDGGISTSPLSYRHWYDTDNELAQARMAATKNIVLVAEELHMLKQQTGLTMHLDIEPEPDGLLETGGEFIDWYQDELLPNGIQHFTEKLGIAAKDAEEIIKRHITLCYDVCHFAIGYEPHQAVIDELAEKGIVAGKIQISAALKATFTDNNRMEVLDAFRKFDEPTYLHQVIARRPDGALIRYKDLPDALAAEDEVAEWRAHFHVPVFVEDFDLLQSTRSDIETVLSIQQKQPFTRHLEVETYTWGVLPDALKVPISQSIIRELEWIKHRLNN